jgi:RNA polymerase sigma factor (sigma-70 family)
MSAPKNENGPCATTSEKAAAFIALKREEYGKLLKIATFMARKFHGGVNYADEEDLLQEALYRVLDVENIRKWYPEKVSFFVFLAGCIRSIASDWKKRARTTDMLDDPPSPIRHDAQTEASIMLERIRDVLKSRPHATEIFDLKCLGLTAREIQERLCLSSNLYGAAVKWIERTLRQEGFRQ